MIYLKKQLSGVISNTDATALVQGLFKKDSSRKEDSGTEQAQLVIDSVDKMSDFLEELKENVSPAMVQVLQSQIKMLGMVQSPAMTGMMTDNLVLCLDKVLKSSSEDEKPVIRESVIRMIQNSVFLSEAKWKYVSDRNKEDALKMFEQAGQMLSESISELSHMSASDLSGVTLDNLLDSESLKKRGFLSGLASVLGQKKMIEEKRAEFFGSLDNLMTTFEKYPDLFGKSIVINGMISKYKKSLVDWFTYVKMEPVRNRLNAEGLKKMSALSDTIQSSINDLKKQNFIKAALNIGNAVFKGVVDIVSAKKAAECDLQQFCLLCDSYEEEIASMRTQINEAETEYRNLLEQHKQIGFFNLSKKKESQQTINEQLENLNRCKQVLKNTENKLYELKNMFPEAKAIKETVDNYASKLDKLELEYAIK